MLEDLANMLRGMLDDLDFGIGGPLFPPTGDGSLASPPNTIR